MEHALLRFSMRVMFRPVFGWRETREDIPYFKLHGSDGSVLQAVCFETQSRPVKGVIVLTHPFLKYGLHYFIRNDYDRQLNDAGYHVMAFNFKGFGASTLQGVSFADDITAAVSWAKRTYPTLAVHLFGLSFGGYHSVHALAHANCSVSSALFDSVPLTISSYFRGGATGVAMGWLSQSRFAQITGTGDLATVLPALTGLPCLFMYGDGDQYVAANDIAKIDALCSDATTIVYEDCDHLSIRKRHGSEYFRAAIEFFDYPSSRAAQRRPIREAATQSFN